MYIDVSVLLFQFVWEAVVRELPWRLSLKALSNKDKHREVATSLVNCHCTIL